MRESTRERREEMGRFIGYARVSTAEQDLGLQLAALRSADSSPRSGGLLTGGRARRHAGGLAS